MSGTPFGIELKKLRLRSGNSTRELSIKVGKAPAYVSQLERGLIKNPDYLTCRELLKLLGVAEENVDFMLERFGIEHPNLLREQVRSLEQASTDDGIKKQTHFHQRKFERLNREVGSITTALLELIDTNMDKADEVIRNIRAMTEGEESLAFLCEMFSHDLSRLDFAKKKRLLRCIEQCTADPNFEEDEE